MTACPKCGMPGGIWFTHVCALHGQSAGTLEPSRTVALDATVWMRIVFAATESEDWRLRTLIEQAVMGPVRHG